MKRLISMGTALFLCGALVAPAVATATWLDQFPPDGTMTSTTNPNTIRWRTTQTYISGVGTATVGWGNQDRVDLKIERGSVLPDDGGPIGFIYDFNRTWSPIDTSTPEIYGRTVQPTGTHFNQLFNIAEYPGSSSGTEGIWYGNLRFFNYDRYALTDVPIVVGIDKTKPTAVNGLAAYSGPDSTGVLLGPMMPTPTSRVHFRWTDSEYDALSGTAYYQMYLNGKYWDSDDVDGPGRVYRLPFVTSAITAEDLPSGKHVVSISAVDRATNEGPKRNLDLVVDADVPNIWLTEPSGGWINGKQTFTAHATDDAGLQKVDFYVGSKLVGTAKGYPYSVTPNLSTFSQGRQTVRAVAQDLYGRQVSTKPVAVTLDRTPPTISSISDTPDPFYPRKRDGYKDNSIIRFNVSEPATVKIDIFNSAGKVVRTLNSSKPAGSSTMSWDGNVSSAYAKANDVPLLAAEGTYHYRITATDRAGNATVSAKYPTTIAYVEFQRLASNQVRVIQR